MDKFVNNLIKRIGETNPQFTNLQLKKMEYGLLCFFDEVTKFILYIILLGFFSLQQYFILVCLFFCPIRLFSGGFHCKTYWGCFFFSLTVLSIPIVIGRYFSFNNTILVILLIISFLLILIFSPVDNINKRIKSMERRNKLKIISILITLILSLFCCILPGKFLTVAVLAIFCSVMMMMIGKFVNLLQCSH